MYVILAHPHSETHTTENGFCQNVQSILQPWPEARPLRRQMEGKSKKKKK